MFEIVKDIDREVLELDILSDYVNYLVKKLELEKCEFNIIIVDNERIHEINREYRNVDRETDVISFAMEDNMDIKIIVKIIDGVFIINLSLENF